MHTVTERNAIQGHCYVVLFSSCSSSEHTQLSSTWFMHSHDQLTTCRLMLKL